MTKQEKSTKKLAREVRKMTLRARENFNRDFKFASPEERQAHKEVLVKNLERWEKFVREYENLHPVSDCCITEP